MSSSTPGNRGNTAIHNWQLAALTVLLSLLACSAPSAPGREQARSADEPTDVHASDKLLAALWMQESAEYRAACEQVFNVARDALEHAILDRGISAMPVPSDSELPPAIIVDLDETIINNGPFQAHQVLEKVGWSSAGWEAWVSSNAATFVPGAERFISHVLADGRASIFYVSNRTERELEATLSVLQAVDPALRIQRDRIQLKTTTPDKSARRDAIAGKNRVIMLIGDDLCDFTSIRMTSQSIQEVINARRRIVDEAELAGRWGRTWFLLPNPCYGSWLDVYGNPSGEEGHQRRLERLGRSRLR